METFKNKYDFVKKQMNILSVNYELGEWTSDIIYPYFVGEPSETPTDQEDGYEETTLIVTGFHRGKWIVLEQEKNKIKKHFDPICGLRAETEEGTIAVFYSNAFFIPTMEADLKKVEIHLLIKEWKWKGDM